MALACSNMFFQKRYDRQTDSSCYAALRSSIEGPCWLANALPRHTVFFLAPHIRCSVSCAVTAFYSARLFDLIGVEAQDHTSELRPES